VGGVGLFKVIKDRLVGHGLVVLAFDALTGVCAMHALLEALTILLDAEGLAAGTPLALFPSLHLDRLGSDPAGDPLVHPGEVAALLVAAVHALTVLVALQPCREALTVELHAFGVPAIAHLLLNRTSLHLHTLDFKFKFRQKGTNPHRPNKVPFSSSSQKHALIICGFY
jgi:hypothetical protein